HREGVPFAFGCDDGRERPWRKRSKRTRARIALALFSLGILPKGDSNSHTANGGILRTAWESVG
ncbi:MAG: hypothetical protein IJY23_08720, partial [Clostridia bacterium]|nr:hypothetical protein [Clostridia bacterium]